MILEITRDWLQCREALLPAIDLLCGTHTEDDILLGLFAGHHRLWVNGTSGLVTEITTTPRLKLINVFLAGGKLEEIMPLQVQIENYGRMNGCKRATMLAARDGWQKTVTGGNVGGCFMWKDL